MQRRIGEILVGGRAISAEVRDRALAQQLRSKGRFGTALLELGAIREDLLLRALSVQHGTAPATAGELAEIRPDILRLVPAKLATSLFVVPFKRLGRTLHLAMRDPKTRLTGSLGTRKLTSPTSLAGFTTMVANAAGPIMVKKLVPLMAAPDIPFGTSALMCA